MLAPKPIHREGRVLTGCFKVSLCLLRPAAITACCWWMGNAGWLRPGADVVSVVFSYGKCLHVCPCSVAHSCLKIF